MTNRAALRAGVWIVSAQLWVAWLCLASPSSAETLRIGFFPRDALPEPFVPIHQIRVADAFAGAAEARIR